MNSHVDYDQSDIKHEEDPLSFMEIKVEPPDIKSEVTAEPEEPEQTDVKHEIQLSPNYVASIKTISEVEDTEGPLVNFLDYQKELQKEHRNTEETEINVPILHEINETYEMGVELEDCGNVYNNYFKYNNLLTKMNIRTADEHLQSNICNNKDVIADEKSFMCNRCNKSFTQKAHLILHMRIHTGEKPFKCNFCSKSFYCKGDLTRHIRTHTGEKPFTCSTCNKSFSQKCTLAAHMYVHTEEKPFTCTVCSRSFSVKFDLTRHELTHTGVNTFTCDICNRSFYGRGDLTRHGRIHTGEKPYTCNICSRAFSCKSNLTRHIRLHSERERITFQENDPR